LAIPPSLTPRLLHVPFPTTPRPPTSPLFPYTTLFRSYIAAFGSVTAFTFGTDGSVEVQPVPIRDEVLDELETNLVILWTGVERRSEEHTSELQSLTNLVCRLLLEKKKKYIRSRAILNY